MPLDQVLDLAWRTRVKSRPQVLRAVYPTSTMSVSVTGKACSMNCSHCGGRYLEHMVDLTDVPAEMSRRNPASILLSGGCDGSGSVPIRSALNRILPYCKREDGSNREIIAHTGIVDEEAAKALSEVASVVSFDFVLDEVAIKEAFHGTWTKEDYVRAFRYLRNSGAEVVPHILAGIRKGQMATEYEAVDFLLGEGISRLIFIVFIPTPGTAWENLLPPPPEEVGRLIASTRVKQPDLEIALGCMRPKGKYREKLDVMAISAGVDAIVIPHPAAISEASQKGLTVVTEEECCGFAWSPAGVTRLS